jgi:hypothetical protein
MALFESAVLCTYRPRYSRARSEPWTVSLQHTIQRYFAGNLGSVTSGKTWRAICKKRPRNRLPTARSGTKKRFLRLGMVIHLPWRSIAASSRLSITSRRKIGSCVSNLERSACA